MQLRDRYDDIKAAGGDLVAIGTGDQRYAGAFARDEQIPSSCSSTTTSPRTRHRSRRSTGTSSCTRARGRQPWQTWKHGHRIHKAGSVTQLGATFVLGPGDEVRYSHVDADSTDHAAIPDVLAAVGV